MKAKQKKINIPLSKAHLLDHECRILSLEERVRRLEYPVFSPHFTIGDPVNPSYTTTCSSSKSDGYTVVNKECNCKQSCQPKQDWCTCKKPLQGIKGENLCGENCVQCYKPVQPKEDIREKIAEEIRRIPFDLHKVGPSPLQVADKILSIVRGEV